MDSFESLLAQVGGFGLYQQLLCFLLIPFTTSLCALGYTTQLIVLSTPPMDCQDGLQTTVSPQSVEDSCGNCTFSYDLLFPTISSENGWICSASWRPYSILVAFWLGNMIGAWLLGVVTDKYGRRPVVLICCVTYGVFGFMSAFFTDFYSFLVIRIAAGTVHHTLTHLPFVLVLEFCDASHRSIPLVTIMASYTLGSMLTTLLAYSFWSWRTLVIVTAAPAFIIVPLYWMLPESASWQISQGRLTEATATLHKIAQVNGKKLTKSDVSDMIYGRTSLNAQKETSIMISRGPSTKIITCNEKNSQENNGGQSTMITEVIKYPKLLKRVIVIVSIWIISYMCYYGHTQNTSHLSSNILLSYFLGAAVEIPAWSASWLIERFGRKLPLITSSLMAGLAGVLYAGFVNVGGPAFVTALVGRMFISVTYYVSLQVGPEIFPTAVRGQGVAIAETLGGVAVLISPAVVYLEEVYRGLPLLVFGVLGIMECLLVSFLPETRGKPLPSTLQESEDIQNGSLRDLKCC